MLSSSFDWFIVSTGFVYGDWPIRKLVIMRMANVYEVRLLTTILRLYPLFFLTGSSMF